MRDDPALSLEQEELLGWILRRTDELPLGSRNFTAAVNPASGDFIEMGGERLTIAYSDLEDLNDKKLIRYQERAPMGSGSRPVAERGAITEEGRQYVRRPAILLNSLFAKFHTGDDDLDSLLSLAVRKFIDLDPSSRAEALEALWDAWERLKTVLVDDKKEGITRLLDVSVAEPGLRSVVEAEAKTLTKIGNDFMIRHKETGKTKIERPEHVEYLFYRMYSLVFLILRATGRASV